MNRATLRLDKSAQARKVSQNKRIDPKNLEQQKQIILMKLIDQQMVCSSIIFCTSLIAEFHMGLFHCIIVGYESVGKRL